MFSSLRPVQPFFWREHVTVSHTQQEHVTTTLHQRARSLYQSGTIRDLREAITLSQQLVSLCPLGPDHSTALNNLVACLSARYERLKGIDDLNEIIVSVKKILSLDSAGDSDSSFPSFKSFLALHLSYRYLSLREIGDLNEAIEVGQQALSLQPSGHQDRLASLNNLAFGLFLRFEKLKGTDDLNEAIDLDRKALSLHPSGHPECLIPLCNLTWHHWSRYAHRNDANDLDEAITFGWKACSLFSPGRSDYAAMLTHIATCLSTRYKQRGSIEDLNQALHLIWLELCTDLLDRRDQSTGLNSLANLFLLRFERFGRVSDLEKAIVRDRESLELCPLGHPHRSVSLDSLAIHLTVRFKQLGRINDLEEAVVLGREALSLCPHGHPYRSTSLNTLASCLVSQHEQLGDIEYLNEAIDLDHEALALRPPEHPDRSVSLSNLAYHLSSRYNRLGKIGDLDEALAFSRQALSLHPPGHTYRLTYLYNLANHLSSRYNSLGDIDNLNEALDLYGQALSSCPLDHGNRWMFLNNLASCLCARYGQLGKIEDLDKAFVLSQQALSRCPAEHPGRPVSLNTHATLLLSRYNESGENDDLNKAIVFDREALLLCPSGRVDYPTSLMGLAVDLFSRYRQLGGIEDLNEAIYLDEKALSLFPSGHVDRSASLNNLANHLFFRYRELGNIDDLHSAVCRSKESLSLCPVEHPGRPQSLANFAAHMFAVYDLTPEHINVVDDAITKNRTALLLCKPGDRNHSSFMNNLALCHFLRFKRLEEIADLDHAIDLWENFLEILLPGHPTRSIPLYNLAQSYYSRFKLPDREEDKKDREEDKDKMFSLYATLERVSPTVSLNDLSIAKEWVNVAEKFSHPTTISAYETALRLLVEHSVALPSLPQHFNFIKSLSSSLAVDAFSACLRNKDPIKAVELLEQGRSVFWSQLARLRSPLEDIIASGDQGKEMADEFTRLTSQIRRALNSDGPQQHDQVCRLNSELGKVVSQIRKLPGFSRFLLPSLFSDLQKAARDGPVIIMNASQYGCDALVVFSDKDPIHIPLSATKEGVKKLSLELSALTMSARRMTNEEMERPFYIFLRKMWDTLVSPIVDVLQNMQCPLQSRIWWCPTAEFSLLPLHAASPYRSGKRGVSDLYLSSYATTLTALIRARRADSPSEKPRFIAIGQATPKGASVLPSVGAELDTLGQLVSHLTTFRRIEGEEACVSTVAEELSNNDWAHFACHGLPNRKKPFESAFALYDGGFTIQHISQCDFRNPEFVYLSACHTMVGDQESLDEAIHLAASMQFAGFQSVIGTLWAVDDTQTNQVISKFYELMVDDSTRRLDYMRAARVLRFTTKKVNLSMDQRILYIHLGA